LEQNPYDVISDGDHLTVDADHGLVIIDK
jgi:phosphohistidine swiveling domain-containing protein